MNLWFIGIILGVLIHASEGLDLGLKLALGLTPRYYRNGEHVDLLVNKVESDHTQLPYSYYDLKFICPHSADKKPLHLSLGEILRGDRLWQSDYKLTFGNDISCARLCDFNAKGPQLKFADKLIKQGYVVHWSIDGLPGATTFLSNNKNSKYYAAGFPLGFFKDDVSYLYNHYMLVIRYHTDKKNPALHTIVGFEVYPKSVVDETCPGSLKNYQNLKLDLKTTINGEIPKTRIPYTYSVYWREDNSVDYANRWALYYENDANGQSNKIHWMSFSNSLVMLSLVTLIVLLIYNRIFKNINTGSDIDGNWKNLGNDALNTPTLPLLLSVVCASGVQLIIATTGIIASMIIKSSLDLNRAKGAQFNNYQGAFSSFALSCFIFSGIIPSYFGVILHKIFNNEPLNVEYPKLKNTRLSLIYSGFLPAVVLSVMLLLNFFVFAKESSSALPFGTIVVLLLLFHVVVLPLGFLGGFYGNKTKFNEKSGILPISSQNKEESLYSSSPSSASSSSSSVSGMLGFSSRSSLVKNSIFIMVIYGLIPFSIVYVELSFIFNTVWLEKTTFYYMYGFLFITSCILVVIIIESTIIGIYINLIINNNPKWHWFCFRIGASIGLYIYGYSFYYFFIKLKVYDFVSILLYFGYMGLVATLVGISCGSISVLTGLVFIRTLYGTAKRD